MLNQDDPELVRDGLPTLLHYQDWFRDPPGEAAAVRWSLTPFSDGDATGRLGEYTSTRPKTPDEPSDSRYRS